jgi:twitching motility protein PilU
MTASPMEADYATTLMHHLLRTLAANKGSDLFVSPPAIKVDGKMTPIPEQLLTPQFTLASARAMTNDR